MSSAKITRKRSPLKGRKSPLSKQKLIDRAVLAAKTRAKNRARAEGVRGKPKKISLVIDETLLNDFEECRKKARDATLTAGIRRAMQEFIRQEKTANS